MFHDILVPLDGSGFAERALPLARRIAARCGATLHLARVHILQAQVPPVPEVLFDPALEARDREAETRYLQIAAASLQQDGLTVGTRLLEGDPGPALAAEARRIGADLLVLTTHGRDPVSRMWLGSVADYLLRHLDLPRLLVHGGSPDTDLPAPDLPHRILVPLDRSELAETALPAAVALASFSGAELELLGVVEPVVPIGDPTASYPADLVRAALDAMEQLTGEYLERIAATLRCDGRVVTTRCVVDSRVARRICAEAQRDGCDLIAIATHGAGGIRRLLLGSVTDKVVRGSSIPVLVTGGHP